MTSSRLTASCGACFLGAALGALWPLSSAAAQAPSSIQLRGILRDFRRSHPDFEVLPSGGYGHSAGSIDLELGSHASPALFGGGFKVATQWMDKNNHNIAPHLFSVGGSNTVPVVNLPTMKDDPVVDSYNPFAGPYGGSNVGPAPSFVPGSSMPSLSEPVGLGPYQGTLTFSGVGTTTVDTDIHCKEFIVSDQHVVRIKGHVTILVDELFKVENGAAILEFDHGASLALFIKKDFMVQDRAVFSLGDDPARLTISNLGLSDVVVQNQSVLAANVISPDARLYLHNGADFFGIYQGLSVHVQNKAGFHLAIGADVCGVVLDDSAGGWGVLSDGGITSPATFDEWYRDVLGVNMSRPHSITLTDEFGSGEYSFSDGSFFPIDDQLLGNEGGAHNTFFTYAIEGRFVYEACGDQRFAFHGDDDVWVFIDGSLVMDIGGIRPGTDQHIDLDRLGLEDGGMYDFRLFFAQRNAASSSFNITTNIDFLADELVAVFSAAGD